MEPLRALIPNDRECGRLYCQRLLAPMRQLCARRRSTLCYTRSRHARRANTDKLSPTSADDDAQANVGVLYVTETMVRRYRCKWLNFLDCAQMERLLHQEMDKAPETLTYCQPAWSPR